MRVREFAACVGPPREGDSEARSTSRNNNPLARSEAATLSWEAVTCERVPRLGSLATAILRRHMRIRGSGANPPDNGPVRQGLISTLSANLVFVFESLQHSSGKPPQYWQRTDPQYYEIHVTH